MAEQVRKAVGQAVRTPAAIKRGVPSTPIVIKPEISAGHHMQTNRRKPTSPLTWPERRPPIQCYGCATQTDYASSFNGGYTVSHRKSTLPTQPARA